MKIKAFTFLFVAVLGLFRPNTTYAQYKTIVYKPFSEDFCNPERGFYVSSDKKPGDLKATELIALRSVNSVKKNTAKYVAGVSLIYRGYLLTEFIKQPLNSTFLKQLRRDFEVVRQSGLKMIIRFAYTNKKHSSNCPDQSICPPYGDASKQIVLHHIAQLKPLLMENADVIAVVQQGFIGIWGENHYTDYFGDASGNGPGYIADSSWVNRSEVLKALLDAIPKSRMVQVRTPQMKQRFAYGPHAPVSSLALTNDEAYTDTDKSRIGFHNDCFLSSNSDYGTYSDHGNSLAPGKPANEILRKYFKEDSRFTAVGGETCDDKFSPQNDCAPAGYAEEEMASMHYSYLNMGYNNLVNNDWEEQGCMFNIKRKLGYRFSLKKATFPKEATAGKLLSITLELQNEGYAAPYNPRPVQLILRNVNNNSIYTISLKTNIRKWHSGPVLINEEVLIVQDIIPGTYELLIAMPDACASLQGNSAYSIRLANEKLWEENTGYNRLNHRITIQ